MKTVNNWLKSNYLDVACGDAPSFQVYWNDPYHFKPLNFKDALYHNCYCIKETYHGRDLYVGLSGGADSEAMARALHRFGIIFTPIIVKSDINQEDYFYALRLCGELNLVPFIRTTTEKEMVDYYLRVVAPNRNDGFTSVHQMLVVEKAAELGGVALLGETHLYDPDPNRSIVKAFKFLPDLIYSDVVPFYYYTIELVRAEMLAAQHWDGTTQQLKARLRGTFYRDKITPKYKDTKHFHIAARHLRSEWLYCDKGTPQDFLNFMEKYQT